MQWRVLIAGVVVACGDNGARPDAHQPADVRANDGAIFTDAAGSCAATSDCSGSTPVCCLVVSPGGATYSSCGAGGGSFCADALCDAAVAGCAKPDGTAGTCMLESVIGPNQTQMFWLCR